MPRYEKTVCVQGEHSRSRWSPHPAQLHTPNRASFHQEPSGLIPKLFLWKQCPQQRFREDQTEGDRERARVVCALLVLNFNPILNTKTEPVLCVGRSGGQVTLKWLKTLPPSLLTTSNLYMCSLFKRCGCLGAGTLEFYVGGDLGGAGQWKGEGVSGDCVWASSCSAPRPGHQSPVFSSSTLSLYSCSQTASGL